MLKALLRRFVVGLEIAVEMTVVIRVFLIAGLGVMSFLMAASTGNAGCLEEINKDTVIDIIDSESSICPESSGAWTIRLHLNKAGSGPLTDGTLLHILHLSQPDFAPDDKKPLPIVLMPLTDQVWAVKQMLDGIILSDPVREQYFIWSPGRNRDATSPYGVNWGDDSALLFRCLPIKGGSCITYYAIPDCYNVGDVDAFISVRRPATVPINNETLADFAPLDQLSVELRDRVRSALCMGN